MYFLKVMSFTHSKENPRDEGLTNGFVFKKKGRPTSEEVVKVGRD